ncbi:Ger(x)C family spore germination protein [Peribacillus alkalitolerans]|uniref:Ger(x)C family spore germination protein n=1 Tax=Peribacillus alkalitolerans TaxID=1550385 RepID=UPI0013D0B20C|nr:Ger(x)C family spore germination protein [Peribacillus alkalitolerans]
MKHYFKKTMLLILVIISILPITGCWDSNEPEGMVYAHGMGIDFKDGVYTVYLEIINLGLLAKSEAAGGAAETKVEVAHASGESIDAAAFNMYHTTQIQVFWGHLTYLVLSDEALKHGALEQMLELMDRYRETRYRIWLYSTKDPINKVFTTMPMYQKSTNNSLLSNPEASFNQSSIIRALDLREILLSIHEPAHEAKIPNVTISKERFSTEKQKHDALMFDGISVVTSNKLKGHIKGNKAMGLKWMNNELKRDELTAEIPDYTDVSLLVEKVKSKIEPDVKGEKVTFKINIEGKAIIDILQEDVPLKKIEAAANKKIKNQVMKTYKEGLKIDSDMYRFSEVLYRKKIDTWKKIEQNGKIPLDKNSISEVKVKIKVIHGGKNKKEPVFK